MKRIYAVCGKGGVGKTAFTAMLAGLFAESPLTGRLLLIDADPALGLVTALGMTVEKTVGNVREAVIKAAREEDGQSVEDVAGELDYMIMQALVEKENYAVLAMGRSEAQGCFCPVNNLLRDCIGLLAEEFDTILIDGEAGLEQINRQVVSRLDELIILTDGSRRGLDTVKLLTALVRDERVVDCGKIGVVFNRVSVDEAMLGASVGELGVDVLGFIPQDQTLAAYDIEGRSLEGLPGDNPARRAMRKLFEKLIN